jgi:hypothetical protein
MRVQLALLLLLCFACAVNKSDQSAKMSSIFNGRNFENWMEPDNNIWWSVKDGIIHAESGPDKKGSILWTEEEYEDFVVQLDFKMGRGTVDSGIFMRGDGADAPQIQIGESGSLKRDMTASPYVPKQGYPVEAERIKELLKADDWNTMKARAVGNVYTVWLNGEEVMNYTMENAKLKGPIGLQLHPNREMSVSFRNISVAKL